MANLTSSNDPSIFKQIPKPAAPVEISEQMIAEIRDRENRKLNVMVFGLPLSKTAKSEKDQEYYDNAFIDEMCWQVDINQRYITRARRFKLRKDNSSARQLCSRWTMLRATETSSKAVQRLGLYRSCTSMSSHFPAVKFPPLGEKLKSLQFTKKDQQPIRLTIDQFP